MSVNPFVPNGIVVFKILHIRQPNVGSQEFRFVCAGFRQKSIDARKHLLGLYFYVASRLGRHAASADDSIVYYDKANDREHFHAEYVLQTRG